MSFERLPSPTRWWTLIIVSVTTYMLMLDLSIVSIAIPQIKQSLGSSFSDLQWVYDAYALTLAICLVAAGSTADRTGRKRVFLLGLAVFTVASFLCGIAGDAASLNWSRAVQGVGAAVMFAVGPALLGHEFHGKERATAFTAFGAAVGLAVATGPLVGGALTDALSWRWIFFINVPIGLVAAIGAVWRIPESRALLRVPTDWGGALTFSVALGALVFATIRGPSVGWTSPQTILLYIASALFLGIFLLIERTRRHEAMFDLSFFRNPTFVGISLVAMIGNAAALPSVFLETNYLQSMLGNTAWQAGVKALPLTLAMFVAGAIAGSLIGKVPFRVLLGGSAFGLGMGIFLLLRTEIDSSWTVLIPSMIVSGAAMGAFNPARAALAIGVTEPAKAGVASGINETFQQVGIAVGMAAVGAFFQHRVISTFLASDVAAQLGPGSRSAGEAVAAGGIEEVAGQSGPLADAVRVVARTAYLDGFHGAMALSGLLACVAGVLGFALLRSKDLHSTAVSTIPPDVDDVSVGVDSGAQTGR